MKREDEEFCKEQFDTFAKRYFEQSKVNWVEVRQKNEPPDYYLLLCKHKYAVEVTTLLEKFNELPQYVITEFFRKFISKVEDEANKKGILKGHYIVAIHTPIDNFINVHDQIKDDLISYVEETIMFQSI